MPYVTFEGARARGWTAPESSVRRKAKDRAVSEVEEVAPPGASFRVYTSQEIRVMPLRQRPRALPARGLGEELRDGWKEGIAKAGPRAILRWVGTGAAVCVVFLAALVTIGNLTDDTRDLGGRASALARSSAMLAVSDTLEIDEAPEPAVANGTSVTSAPPGTDFELPDDSAPPQRSAALKAHSVKQGKRHIVRTAPY